MDITVVLRVLYVAMTFLLIHIFYTLEVGIRIWLAVLLSTVVSNELVSRLII